MIPRPRIRATIVWMSDDWRDKDLRRASSEEREEGYVRWRLEQHRDALRKLAESAPVHWVAERCLDLSNQIDTELGVEDRRFTHSDAPLPEVALIEDDVEDTISEDPELGDGEIDRLILPRVRPSWEVSDIPPQPRAHRSVSAPIVVIGSAIVFLSVIAGLIWWTQSPDPPVRKGVAVPPGPAIEVTEERLAMPESSFVAVEPTGHDYGLVFRGQRGTQTFAIRNLTDDKLEIRMQRSQCRCLWYQYDDELEPGESAEITIALDGGRIPSGRLTETVGIVLRDTEELIGEIHLTAEIESALGKAGVREGRR